MSIIQTRKQSDIEKRLKLLRQQVYGRSSENSVKVREEVDEKVERGQSLITHQYHTSTSSLREASHSSHPTLNPQLLKSDVVFLRQDLIKITSFATVAFGVQIVLYFLLRNHILNLNFF